MTLLRRFTITLPAGMPLLNVNQFLDHKVKSARVKALRAAAKVACLMDPAMRDALFTAGHGPVLEHAYILGVLHPASDRRLDPANWYPSFKAIVDGLVDAGVLEDDDHTRVIGPDMRAGGQVAGAQLTVHVQEISAEQLAAFHWPAQPAAVTG